MPFFTSLLAFIAGFLLCCLTIPSIRSCIIAVEDTLSAHEAGLCRVSLRVPVRETGPQNMAQLIMLRHKINQTNTRRRRSPSHSRESRQAPRAYIIPPSRTPRNNAWARLGRALGNYHH